MNEWPGPACSVEEHSLCKNSRFKGPGFEPARSPKNKEKLSQQIPLSEREHNLKKLVHLVDDQNTYSTLHYRTKPAI